MTRPIWKGNITFGLINIPITLYSAESRFDLHFKLLDSRDHAHIRYERINEVTGAEVPWNEVVKAYEFDHDNYVILEDKDLKEFAAENFQSVEIKDFIDQKDLDSIYFEKPYYLIPGKHAEKGYVLLRETLKRTHKVGICKIVIRTREYLSALLPYQNGLVINLMRFPQELRKPEEFEFPKGDIKSYKISEQEVDMAERLIKSMSTQWNPKKYHDEYRDALMKWIEKKMEGGKSITAPTVEEPEPPAKKGAKIIDFMPLLKKSLEEKGKSTKAPKKPSAKKKTLTKTKRKK